MKIISTVPSLTELLFSLGCGQDVVGRTKFCVHPKSIIRTVPKIGGTKSLNIEAIKKLTPDLVIANKEENTKDDIEAISTFSEVLLTEIATIDSAFASIVEIGKKVNREKEARALGNEIAQKFGMKREVKKKVCYLIWKDPFMTIGSDTFIHSMMDWFGYENVFEDCVRYPMVNEEEIVAKSPDFLFLSSEPYPFKNEHVEDILKIIPTCKPVLVDGELFSWYGSRMLRMPDYITELENELLKYNS